MIERAILQEVHVSRDGTVVQRVAERPESVRATAQRMNTWRDRPEACVVCGTHAVSIRGRRALCAGCREEDVRRVDDVRREPVETVTREEAEGGLSGYAIVFGQLSHNLGGFREMILPSAVTRTLSDGVDVCALWNHEPGTILGRVKSGTLSMRADKHGLGVYIHPPRWAAGHVESVERGDVTGMSFGFNVHEDEWHMGPGGIPIREVSDMSFSEVSAVGFPAYPQTTLRVGALSGKRVQWLKKWHQTRIAR